jgi:putative membrane protein
MLRLLATWLANSLAILAVASVLRGIVVGSWPDAFMAGAVLSIVNALVRPVLLVLTLPLTLVTLGLFYFVISGFCLWLTARLIPGFEVHGVLVTVIASILISVISTVISLVLRR